MTGRDRLTERVDLLVADFLVDVRREQTGRQARVLRLLGDQRGRGMDRQAIGSLVVAPS